MKSSQIAIGILLALCAGCATKEMSSTPFYTGHEVKYTGRVEDRVNLWPAAYYRAPVGSIAWPLISFSDDHFAFRPLYSQYQKHGEHAYNEFNVLWPIAQFDTYEELYRIFPFIWGDGNFCLFPEVWKGPGWWGVCPFFMANNADWVTLFPLFFGDFAGDNQYHTIFPLYYHSSKTSAEHETSYFWTALGLWGYKRRDGAFLNHRLLPLYYADQDDFWSIPYAHFDEGATKKNMLLGGLAGLITKDDHYDASWFLPLFFHHEGDFGSLLWCHGLGSQGEMEFAMVPPLLSWYERNGSKKEACALLGLGGYRQDGDQSASWLFPLFYNDSATFATALFGRTDKGCDWCVPLYWRDADTFASLLWCQERGKDGKLNWAISPLLLSGYGRDQQTGEESTQILLGLGGKTTTADGHAKSWAFPLFYNDDDLFVTALFGKTKTSDWLVPLYYRDEETFVTPLFGLSGSTSWLAPILYNDDDLFLTPLYGKTKTSDWLLPLYYRNDDVFATALFGKTKTADWCVPLYYRDEDVFASLFYWQNRDPKTGEQTAVVPPLLGGVTWDRAGTCRSWEALLGLVGGTRDAEGKGVGSWAFPLYYHDTNTFASVLWWHNEKPRTGDQWTFVPPLLTGWNTSKTGKVDSWVTLAGLAGATYDDENLHQQWLAPLYMYDKHDGFYSIPYSIDGLGHARTNHIFCAGLAKIYTGSQHGAHIPFLFDWKKDRGFDELLAIQDRDELPEDVTFKDVVVTNKKTKVVSTHRKGTYKGRAFVSEGDKMSIFVSDNNKSVSAYMDKSYLWGTQDHSPKDDAWCLHSCGKRGNKLVFNTEWDRYTNFSAETRKKVKDEMKSSTSLFAGILFSHESEAKPFEKKVKSETRVLWRLWHREEKDGNVSVDMFPGFTYDAHQDGYRKSSFLWRFFRSEHDPKKGDSLDLLFLPIVRP